MEAQYKLFLQAIRSALQNQPLDNRIKADAKQMQALLELAQAHHVLPMIFEAVHQHPAMEALDADWVEKLRGATIHTVMAQAVKTVDFLKLFQHLRKKGLCPLVVKGIICRELYPKPDHRYSGDEDVLCERGKFSQTHQALLSFGMAPAGHTLETYEVPYCKADSPLYIELHKSLFAQNSDVFKDYNRFFDGAFERAVEVEVRGMPVATLCPTDHMLYLIIHAYKHFLHSGFGIRQLCDISVYANAYGTQVDWEDVYQKCRSIRADKFAVALFQIGEKYLVFSPKTACQTAVWQSVQVNEWPLLEDMLRGGIYGSADRNRVHSSNMTLNAVAKEKHGKKSGKNILRTVFPSAAMLEGRYPYLQRHKYLLPVAWGSRIFGFTKESLSGQETAPTDVVRTGSRRIELLRLYDIIDR